MKKILVILLVSLGLQTQAQVNWCDSISYSISQSFPLTMVGNSSLPYTWTDSIQWYWGVCTNGVCYAGTSQSYDSCYTSSPATFQNVLLTDTIKVCYDALIYSSFTTPFTCTGCDSLIYDFMTGTWVLFSMSNTTSINELTFNRINDGKIYDMLGREVTKIQIGQMYIRNNKKYIRTR